MRNSPMKRIISNGIGFKLKLSIQITKNMKNQNIVTLLDAVRVGFL